MSTTSAGPLRLETDVPTQVRAGERVPVTLRVTNAGMTPIDLALLGRSLTFDIVVSAADGATVWRRLEGATIPMILQLRTLAAGETLVVGGEWDQRRPDGQLVEPGRYVVEGELLTDAEPLRTPPATLRIGTRER